MSQVTEHANQLYNFIAHQDSASNWISSSTGTALYIADYTREHHTMNYAADTVRALYDKGKVAPLHAYAYGRVEVQLAHS